jgi:5-methylcytosine-specific restriction endonuclease McrA
LIEYLEFMTAKELKKKSPSTATVAVTPKLRREIVQEQCAHVYEDGSQCTNRWQVQVDHKISKWKGGSNERSNLQPMCAQHNRDKYRRESTAV